MNLIAQLRDVLGPAAVCTGAEIPARNRTDAAAEVVVEPLALVLPRSTAEVAAVLALCHAAGQPVVPQGGMTGLVDASRPVPGEIAISLERMSGVEEVDPVSGTITALAGTLLEVIQKAAEAAGMMIGIDLGARGSCTVGGNVATNAGGNFRPALWHDPRQCQGTRGGAGRWPRGAVEREDDQEQHRL